MGNGTQRADEAGGGQGIGEQPKLARFVPVDNVELGDIVYLRTTLDAAPSYPMQLLCEVFEVKEDRIEVKPIGGDRFFWAPRKFLFRRQRQWPQ